MVLIWIIYGLLPVLDEYLPRDEANPTKQEQHKMKNMLRYKIPLYPTPFSLSLPDTLKELSHKN